MIAPPLYALSLTQPWASLVACGEKRIETRSWPTHLRGLIAIHAAKGFPRDARALLSLHPFQSALQRPNVWVDENGTLPRAAIIAVVELTHCYRFSGDIELDLAGVAAAEHEAAFGNYAEGRYGYVLEKARRLAIPIPVRGWQRFWRVPSDLGERIVESLVAG